MALKVLGLDVRRHNGKHSIENKYVTIALSMNRMSKMIALCATSTPTPRQGYTIVYGRNELVKIGDPLPDFS